MIQSVLFIVRGDHTFPSSRFRAWQFQAPLEQLGVRVGYLRAARTWMPHTQLRFLRELSREVSRYDAVVYQKLQHPFHIRFVASRNPNTFYDYDDALWLTSSKLRFAMTMRAAPRILAGNRFLAERAADFCSDISVVPTTVVMPQEPVTPPVLEGPLRLSWIGSACNLYYLAPVLASLRELRARGLDIEIDILTEDPAQAPVQEGVSAGKWSHEAENTALRACHVGLMPLVDDEWSRGKCACKAIQYLSYGRPVIASPVGINRDILAGKPYALLPEKPGEWTDALVNFAQKRAELGALGQVGRKMVSEELSVDVWAKRLVHLLSARTSK